MDCKRKICWVGVVIGLFALYFAGLGSYPVIDPDEPVYAQVGKEMAQGAGWLTPHYAGREWFDKPPLFYWLAGVSELALGPTEFASRLPSAILAVGLVLLVYALATYDFGRRAGVLSAVVMATCIQQIVLARASVTDMTLAFCLTFALYAYRRWFDADGRARVGWAALCGAMTGLGMLTKGPVAPVLLAATFVIHLAWTHRLARLRTIDAMLAVFAALAVGLPWYIAMYALHGDEFVKEFLGRNNIARFLKPEHAEQTGAWYSYFVNIPIMLAMFFPWSVFVPSAMARKWRENDGAKLAFVWFAVVFVFFSLSKTILVTYIFPAYSAAAIFVGAFWAATASNNDEASRRAMRTGLWVTLVISLLIGGFLIVSAQRKYPEAQMAAVVLSAIMMVGAIAGLVFTRRRSRFDASVGVWAIGAGMAVFSLWLVYGIVPFVTPRASTKDLLSKVPRISGARYVTLGADRPSIVFYLGKAPLPAASAAEANEMLAESEPVFVICDQPNAKAINAPGSEILARSGNLMVVTNADTLRRGKVR